MNEIGFLDKQAQVVALAEKSKTLIVTNAQEHTAAGLEVNAIRDLENALAAEYAAHPVIIESKRLQGIKGELATILEDARKLAKQKMILFEDSEGKKRKAEEARQEAEARKIAESEALAAAITAEEFGSKEDADAILEAPVIVPVVIIPKSIPKVEGHTRRTIWKFRIKNAALIPRQFLIPDEKAIGGVVRALKESTNIAGVEIFMESV